ncbi:MAG: ATP-binding protein [Chloroflexota bacterium]
MTRLRSLSLKLVIAFALVCLTGITLIAVYVWRATTDEFGVFLVAHSRTDLVARWVEYYRRKDSWEGIARAQEWQRPPAPLPDRPPPTWVEASRVAVVDVEGRVVLAGRGYREGEIVSKRVLRLGVPIEVDGKVVGRLLLGFVPSIVQTPRDRFIQRFTLALLMGGGGAIAAALLVGVLLSHSLTRPLRDLTAATEAVSRGELDQRIEVRSRDELGELAQSFNRMSARLAQAQALRRQMTADIAHELRTPLSLILGHAEAVADGVLAPTHETLGIIYDEAQRLVRLVDDLRTLSLSDAGELSLYREPSAPRQLLASAAAAHQPMAEDQGVRLGVVADEELPTVDVDPDRIAQVLDNLLTNALRYTPQGGEIILSAQAHADGVALAVRDSGPGFAEADLPHLFERFFRSDASRQREGGSGLGMAIARSMVELHGGRIWAENAPGGGARVVFSVPAANSGQAPNG